ncbi:MAG: glycosyltransferase family 4 protein [Odoribacter sp.]
MEQKKYKIIYFIECLSKKGGTEKVLATKASYFADVLGYEIHIILFQSKDKGLAYEYSPKIKIHYLEDFFTEGIIIPGFSQMIAIRRAKKYYSKLIEIIKPDIMIGLGLGLGDFIFPSIARGLKIPIIREFHYSTIATKKTIELCSSFWGRFKQHVIFKRMFKSFQNYDHLVLLTQQDLQEGNYKDNCTIIPNVLNSSESIHVSTCEQKRVISVGSLRNPIKRFDKQIRLWKEINTHFPEWKLDIYGDGPERSNLQALINKLDLSCSITLHGNVDNIGDKYLNSSIFIFTSDGEGLPMVILEAMSYGLPIVSYACSCGPKDAIRHGLDGYVINMDDEEGFIKNLLELMKNQELRDRMGKSAKNRSGFYSAENIYPQWCSFFDKVVNSYHK